MSNTVELLTDDELAALADIVGEPLLWGALPTVDLRSEDSVREAVLRGARSLLARNLVDDGELVPDLDSQLRRVLGAEALMRVYLGDHDGQLNSWGLNVALFGGPSGWMSQALVAPGLHKFADLDEADARGLFATLLEQMTGVDGDHRVWLMSITNTDRLLVDVTGAASGSGGLYAVGADGGRVGDESRTLDPAGLMSLVDRTLGLVGATEGSVS